MRKLNSRELTLAIGLGSTIFILANLLFFPRLLEGIRELEEKNTDLKAQLTAAQSWIANEEQWNSRRTWFEENQPLFDERGVQSAEQLERLQEFAESVNVKLDDVQLLRPEGSDFHRAVAARLKAVGPWSDMLTFLAEFQRPDTFEVMPELNLRSGPEPPEVIAELQLELWYRVE